MRLVQAGACHRQSSLQESCALQRRLYSVPLPSCLSPTLLLSPPVLRIFLALYPVSPFHDPKQEASSRRWHAILTPHQPPPCPPPAVNMMGFGDGLNQGGYPVAYGGGYAVPLAGARPKGFPDLQPAAGGGEDEGSAAKAPDMSLCAPRPRPPLPLLPALLPLPLTSSASLRLTILKLTCMGCGTHPST